MFKVSENYFWKHLHLFPGNCNNDFLDPQEGILLQVNKREKIDNDESPQLKIVQKLLKISRFLETRKFGKLNKLQHPNESHMKHHKSTWECFQKQVDRIFYSITWYSNLQFFHS